VVATWAVTIWASAAVKIASVSELKAVLAIAYRNDLPVTIRGGATGNYGQCIPLCGGLVVDITGLDRIIDIAEGVVTTQSGVRVVNLEKAVREGAGDKKAQSSENPSGKGTGYDEQSRKDVDALVEKNR
jgi:FAD/FMN-containing dehydrogenase